MKYVADTNVFLAVALDEPERDWLIEATKGHELLAPAVLPFEVCNALSALVKRTAISPGQATELWDAITAIPVELAEIDIRAALELAAQNGLYAYDAYFLRCALETRCPLLTLDQAMIRVAKRLNLAVMESP
jgi:predicted nucleic acid-binding protein